MALTGHSASWHKACNTCQLALGSQTPCRAFENAARCNGVDQGGASSGPVHARTSVDKLHIQNITGARDRYSEHSNLIQNRLEAQTHSIPIRQPPRRNARIENKVIKNLLEAEVQNVTI